MQNKYDLIILGGGCAGLSLAMKLSAHGESCPKVLILERRESYVNDRTWCFWDTKRTYLKGLVQKHWPKIEIKTAQGSVVVDVKHTPYQMLPAEVFYRVAQEAIGKNNNITVQHLVDVQKPPTNNDGLWQVLVGNEQYSALSVVDTRPQKMPQTGDAVLWQSFYGHEIACDSAVFSVQTATLMDFDQTDPALICFCYVLPMSATRALIEITVFAPTPMSADDLRPKLNLAIDRYTQHSSYQIIRSEQGILPMGNYTQTTNDTSKTSQTYIYAGLFAGAARPSTGFAFQRIQRWAEQCATSILEKKRPVGHQADSMVQSAMDYLFLQVLLAQPKLAPMIFLKLFAHCDSHKIVRFLSDQAKLSDYLAIIWSLPAWPFLKQLFPYLINRVCRNVARKKH
jgi:lycopene beta-cyclase